MRKCSRIHVSASTPSSSEGIATSGRLFIHDSTCNKTVVSSSKVSLIVETIRREFSCFTLPPPIIPQSVGHVLVWIPTWCTDWYKIQIPSSEPSAVRESLQTPWTPELHPQNLFCHHSSPCLDTNLLRQEINAAVDKSDTNSIWTAFTDKDTNRYAYALTVVGRRVWPTLRRKGPA